MSSEFLPFSKPCIDQATVDEVIACLESGWLTTGPRTQQFEADLKNYCQAPYALALTSATAGLHLALLALDLKKGDEVITTPMTFVATLNTIELAGGKPVLVDVDRDTYNITPEAVERAITPRTKAIMPVHFAGIPVDLDPLYALAEKHHLRVIEDAAHAIGSRYKGKKIGSFGDTQVFSFHPNKVITSGEGGVVTTRDEVLAKTIHTLRFHGIDREAFNRFSKSGSQHYDVVRPGFKYNMLDLQAAIGMHQLASCDDFIHRRKRLAERYLQAFKDWPEFILPTAPAYEHTTSWYIFAPLIHEDNAKMPRDVFMQHLKEHNIGSGLHYEAVHLYRYYRETYGYQRGNFPNAEFIGDRIISLPLFPQMTDAEQDRVIAVIAHIFHKSV